MGVYGFVHSGDRQNSGEEIEVEAKQIINAYPNIPTNLLVALYNWGKFGYDCGGFLTAVLGNDLVGAVSRADHISIKLIPDIVKYIYNELPTGCWGSPETVKRWAERKRREMEDDRAEG